MSLFERCVRLPHPRSDVVAWHLRPGAFRRLSPPWLRVELLRDAPVEEGSRLSLRVPVGPLPGGVRWTAEHRDVDARGFRDVQVEGPFAAWDHLHLVLDDGDGALLRDRIRFRLPLGLLGAVAEPLLRADLERTFAWRHRRTAADLGLHAVLRTPEPRRISVDGGGGVADHLRLLVSGGEHELTDSASADVRLTPAGEQRWVVEAEDGEERVLELPLVLAPDPDCRRLVVRRLLRLPELERPIPWISLDDAAAALLHLALGREQPGRWTIAVPRPEPIRTLALAPVAWIGSPRSLPRNARHLAWSEIPGRHRILSSLLRDALGRTP